MALLVDFLRMVLGTTRYPEIADVIMDELRASELAYILYAVGIFGSFPHGKRHLNPLRDLDPTMRAFNPLIEMGYKIILVGSNMQGLVMRVSAPGTYWRTAGETENQIKVWPIAIHPQACNILLEEDTAAQGASLLYDAMVRGDVVGTPSIFNETRRLMTESAPLIDRLVVQPDCPSNSERSGVVVTSSVKVYKCSLSRVSSLGNEDAITVGSNRFYTNWPSDLFRDRDTGDTTIQYIDPVASPFTAHLPNAVPLAERGPYPRTIRLEYILARETCVGMILEPSERAHVGGVVYRSLTSSERFAVTIGEMAA